MQALSAHRKAARVLAVDDSAEMRILVQVALELHGHSVHAVDCGAAALAAASHERFDLIILDVDMPGMDGLQVGRALREDPRTRCMPIAMHTSLDEDQVRGGFDDYDLFLPKPCSPLQFAAHLDRLLQGASLRREPAAAD